MRRGRPRGPGSRRGGARGSPSRGRRWRRRTPPPPRSAPAGGPTRARPAVRTIRMPFPPPPRAALIITGNPRSSAARRASASEATGSGVPGTTGTPASARRGVPRSCRPSRVIAAGGGPTKTSSGRSGTPPRSVRSRPGTRSRGAPPRRPSAGRRRPGGRSRDSSRLAGAGPIGCASSASRTWSASRSASEKTATVPDARRPGTRASRAPRSRPGWRSGAWKTCAVSRGAQRAGRAKARAAPAHDRRPERPPAERRAAVTGGVRVAPPRGTSASTRSRAWSGAVTMPAL